MRAFTARAMAVLGLFMFAVTLVILHSLVTQAGRPHNSVGAVGRGTVGTGAKSVSVKPVPPKVRPDVCGKVKMPKGWTTQEMLDHWANPDAIAHEGQPEGAEIPVNATYCSIIFVTKRPGGYDVLLNSLAQQTDGRFDLVLVDELAEERAEDVIHYAHKVGIHRIAIMEGKPKPDKYKDHAFSIANALNTGFLLATGPVVLVIMDYAWAPSHLVARTLEFYGQNEARQNHLLAYPEIHYGASNHFESLVPNWVHNGKLLTIFKTPVCKQPSLRQEGINWGGFFLRPDDLIKDESRRDYERQNPYWYWELSCATLPMALLRAVNGVDERVDVGDDCHEANMRQRAEARLKTETWTDGKVFVEQLFHRFQEDPDMWSRSAKNTNLFGLHGELINEVVNGGPLKGENDFDLEDYHGAKCMVWWGKDQTLVADDVIEISSLKSCPDMPVKI